MILVFSDDEATILVFSDDEATILVFSDDEATVLRVGLCFSLCRRVMLMPF